MRESFEIVQEWGKRGLAEGATYLLVVCDTFDYEQYPCFASEGTVHAMYDGHHGPNMQRVEGLYLISEDGSITATVLPERKGVRHIDLVLRVPITQVQRVKSREVIQTHLHYDAVRDCLRLGEYKDLEE